VEEDCESAQKDPKFSLEEMENILNSAIIDPREEKATPEEDEDFRSRALQYYQRKKAFSLELKNRKKLLLPESEPERIPMDLLETHVSKRDPNSI